MSNWKQNLYDAVYALGFIRRDDLNPTGNLGKTADYNLKALLGDDVDRSQWGNTKASQVIDPALINKLSTQGYAVNANSTVATVVNTMLAAMNIKKAVDASGNIVEVSAYRNSSYHQTTATGDDVKDATAGNQHFDARAPEGGWVNFVGKQGRGVGRTGGFAMSSQQQKPGIDPATIRQQEELAAQRSHKEQAEIMRQQQQQRETDRFAAIRKDMEWRTEMMRRQQQQGQRVAGVA